MNKEFILSKKQYMVYISCTTYNHANYIEDALKGFYIQKTNFPFAAIVIDDASTDNEQEVLLRFVNEELDHNSIEKEETDDYIKIAGLHKNNPNCTFVMLLLKYNHVSIRKAKSPYFEDFYKHIKYAAICEGDDYWTNPLKLQKQVDFLETHPDYGLIHAKADSYYQASQKMVSAAPVDDYKEKGFNDIIWHNPVTTLTVLIRKDALDGYGEFRGGVIFGIGDLPMWLYISHRYRVHFMNETVGVYRHVSGSASHGKTYEKRKKYLDNIFKVVSFFAEKYVVEDFDKLENRYHVNLFNEAFAFKKKNDAISEFKKIKHKTFKMYIKRIILQFT